jgi:hypothetical protein
MQASRGLFALLIGFVPYIAVTLMQWPIGNGKEYK